MKTCKKCNIDILDDTNICPLCKSVLSNTTKSQNKKNDYPNIKELNQKYNLATKILALVSVIVIIICAIINRLTYKDLNWYIICIIAITYSWITTMYTIMSNKNIAYSILIQAMCIDTVVILIDVITHYKGWSVNIAIPLVSILSNIASVVVIVVKHRTYYKYIIYQIIILLFSFLPLVLYLFGVCNNLVLVLIAMLVTISVGVGLLIFCGKEIKEEIIKRFHF